MPTFNTKPIIKVYDDNLYFISNEVKNLKILVILTGGTIGSMISGDTIDTDKHLSYRILQFYNKKYGNDVDFQVVQPINILSENLSVSDWKILGIYLLSTDLSIYDGVIITHGSDTLAYSSAFVGVILQDIKKPIAITASNKVLDNPQANGLDNFRGCVQLIKTGVTGVYTIYRNNKNRVIVYNATRLKEADLYSDEFSSWGEEFGEIENDTLKINNNTANLYTPVFKNKVSIDIFNRLNKVMLIRPYPSMDYTNFNIDNIDIVVHTFYHSSTACIEGENTSIIKFIRRCKLRGVKIYGCCDKYIEGSKYASARAFENEEITVLNNVSPEEAYIRAVLGLL